MVFCFDTSVSSAMLLDCSGKTDHKPLELLVGRTSSFQSG